MILVNLEIFVNKGISGYSKESFEFGESGGPCDYGDSCSLSDSGNCKEVYDFGESGFDKSIFCIKAEVFVTSLLIITIAS